MPLLDRSTNFWQHASALKPPHTLTRKGRGFANASQGLVEEGYTASGSAEDDTVRGVERGYADAARRWAGKSGVASSCIEAEAVSLSRTSPRAALA